MQVSHLQALVRLDYYEERRFVFNHLVVGSPESRALLSDLVDVAGNLPSKDGLISLMGRDAQQDIGEITVWTKGEQNMSHVASIIGAYDTPH